jgi:GNAT superfamily N-acetyltransferase
MLRPAVPADLAALLAIRDAAGPDALSDPALVTEDRLIAAEPLMVCDDAGRVVGFAAVDCAAIHLLVDSSARGTGIGRELLAAASAAIKNAGHSAATLTLTPGSTAERHYRAAGWSRTGQTRAGGTILKKPL